MWSQGQLLGVGSFLPRVGSEDSTQIVMAVPVHLTGQFVPWADSIFPCHGLFIQPVISY